MIDLPITFHKLDAKNRAWPDLNDQNSFLQHGGISLAVLEGGTKSGRPSVGIRIDRPGEKALIVETTARLFCVAAKAIMAKYPELFEGDT